MSLVSIIIPYYKNKKFLSKTLLSVFSQTYKKFEIIIIYDDKSDDDLKFIQKIIKNFSNFKIKLIVNKDNFGAGVSRNIGIKNSQGTYIAFLDSDDIWKRHKLEKQIKFMKKNNLDFSHTAFNVINSQNKFLFCRKSKSFVNYEDLLTSCDIGLSTVILKKKIIKKDVKFSNSKTKEDFFLWLKLLKKGYKLIYFPHVLSSWRKTPSSLSSSIIQKLKDGFILYNFYLKYNIVKSLYLLMILSINYLFRKKY